MINHVAMGGFLRGIVEILALRSIDVLLCFPPLLLALLVVTLLGPGAALATIGASRLVVFDDDLHPAAASSDYHGRSPPSYPL